MIPLNQLDQQLMNINKHYERDSD